MGAVVVAVAVAAVMVGNHPLRVSRIIKNRHNIGRKFLMVITSMSANNIIKLY